MAALPQNDTGKMVKVQCGECSKMLSFTNLKRHKKTVHNEDTGKRWICNTCGKASQSEKRLIRHEKLHRSGDCDEEKIYSCNDCDYRTIVERYLVDHKKTQHESSGNGQFIVSVANALKKPTSSKTRGNLICTKHAIKT